MLKSLVQPKSLAIAVEKTAKNAIREIREILNSFIVFSLGFLMAQQYLQNPCLFDKEKNNNRNLQ
jgi:hypothetical protein